MSRTLCEMRMVLTAAGAGGALARSLLPAAIVLPVLLEMTESLGGFGERSVFHAGAMMSVLVSLVLVASVNLERQDAERRRAEEEIRQLNTTLEQRVQKRTAALTAEVAERRAAEEMLQKSQERFRLVTETISDVFWMGTPDIGQIVYISPAYEKLWGQSCESLYAEPRSFLNKVHPEDRKRVEEVMERFHFRGLGYSTEYRIIGVDGSVRWIHERGYPIHNDDGTVRLMAGVSSDVTGRKRAESELIASREALRALAARLEAVREEECKRLAREIHDTFGHALKDWKFDLAWLGRRLAEAGINGQSPIQCKLAAMGQRAEAEMESVQRISGELRPPLLDTLGLAPAIEKLARDFQARTGVRCRLSLSPELPPLDAPRSTAVFRILQELLDNVARHSHATTVGIRLVDRAGSVELRVRDNGRGIPDEAATSPKALGLLGIRERAHALGGEVRIQGFHDRGTIATARLPVPGALKGA